jgi:hypothetical protein
MSIICEFGPPKILQSDEGSEFCNSIVKQLAELTNTELRISTPHHKHSTGAIERVNRTLATSLRKMLSGALATWDTILPIVTHHYNTTTRSLTKSSPYALMFARSSNPLGGGEVSIPKFTLDEWLADNAVESWAEEHNIRLQEELKKHKRVLDQIHPAIQESRRTKRLKTAERFNATHKIVPPLEPGTRVLILHESKASKHDQNWIGPYVVDSVNKTGSYQLKNDWGGIIRRARSQIKLYHEKPDREERKSHRVDLIIKHRGRGKKTQYLVKWTGYSHAENSWVPADDFDDKSLIKEYWDKKAPKRATKSKNRSRQQRGE